MIELTIQTRMRVRENGNARMETVQSGKTAARKTTKMDKAVKSCVDASISAL
ncbi:hypothetical protein [Paenibacillus thiaminolyticus]|uniref:hypothetical protein n=1 Tax=Paenibacillus thiaminolyticus TaxID=49283 RepID=UPI0019809217|nr:hypothetical protein [Paenibacillus thiaminolyticus]